jgi:hypothetical protein
VALFVALPDELAGLSNAVGFKSASREKGWDASFPARRYDIIHAFTKHRAELDAGLAGLQGALKPDGAIWVSWPKKAARVETDMTEDRVREAALKLDLVDVKVAAVDAIWSGLKLVIRKDRRQR